MAGGLKEVRERIGSVQNTMQITSAMKMVSAAKLRRAQDAITRIRPYAEKIQEIITNVSSTLAAPVFHDISVLFCSLPLSIVGHPLPTPELEKLRPPSTDFMNIVSEP